MGDSHQTFATSHPRKRGLLVEFEEKMFLQNPKCLPEKGTKYSACRKLFSNDLSQKFGDYIYTRQGPNSSSGNPTLFFAPPIEEGEDPDTPFETETSHGNHYWPPILRALVFIPDKSVPITSRVGEDNFVLAYRHFVRRVFIPSVSEGTLFTVDKFLYPYEPIIPQHDVPVPTSVSWDFLDSNGNFEECLHPKIIIPDLRTSYSFTAGGSSAGALAGQIFPATNFIRWADYVVKDGFEFQNGVYIRTRVTVTPPPEPRRIIR